MGGRRYGVFQQALRGAQRRSVRARPRPRRPRLRQRQPDPAGIDVEGAAGTRRPAGR